MNNIIQNISIIFKLLSKKDNRRLFFLSIMMLFSIIFETLNIALILPLVSLVSDPEGLKNYPIVLNMLENISYIFSNILFKIDRENILAISTIIIFSIFFIFRQIFFLLVYWSKERFLYHLKTSFSFKLYSGYLKLPLLFHLKNNSSTLVRNSVQEVEIFSRSVILLLGLISDLILFLFLVSVLLFFSFKPTLLIMLIFISISLIYLIATKEKMKSLSKERLENDRKSFLFAKQGLEAIKEIIVNNKSFEFASIYFKKYSKLSKISLTQNIFTILPRLVLETSFLFILIFLILYTFSNEINFINIIPILALYIGAAFRLLPTITRILTSINLLSISTQGIKVVKDQINLVKSNELETKINNSKDFKFKDRINVKNISFKYDNSSKKILEDVSLEIPKGSITGIIGHSGAGKSTLISIIAGLLKPSKGNIFIDNNNIFPDAKNWQKKIGYVPQSNYMIDDSILNNIAFGVEEHAIDIKLVEEVIKKVGLEDFVKNLPNSLSSLAGERGSRFSGGQVQRLVMARALYKKPSVLILDESTNSLDIKTEENIFKMIKSNLNDITVIIISHRNNLSQICDHCYEIIDGRTKKINI